MAVNKLSAAQQELVCAPQATSAPTFLCLTSWYLITVNLHVHYINKYLCIIYFYIFFCPKTQMYCQNCSNQQCLSIALIYLNLRATCDFFVWTCSGCHHPCTCLEKISVCSQLILQRSHQSVMPCLTGKVTDYYCQEIFLLFTLLTVIVKNL